MAVADRARLAAAAHVTTTPCGEGRMVWHLWGEGSAVVLLHGGFGSWTHWLRTIETLTAAGFRVVAADLPGLGDSDAAPEPYSAESIAAIVGSGLMTVLAGEDRFDLVGFSFGALIGGHVAAALGRRCRTLTLVGAGGLGLMRSAMEPLVLWRGLDDQARREAHRRNLAILMFSDPARIDDAAIDLQAENAERGRTRSPPIARTDTLARMLPRVTARLAGIWGEQDATALDDLPARARLLRGIQPGCPFLVIADAGHWVQYEAADAFNATLLALLERRP